SVLRLSRSSNRVALIPAARHCSAARKRCSSWHTSNGWHGLSCCARCNVCCSSDQCGSSRGKYCFGQSGVDSGHRRLPCPPARITGTSFIKIFPSDNNVLPLQPVFRGVSCPAFWATAGTGGAVCRFSHAYSIWVKIRTVVILSSAICTVVSVRCWHNYRHWPLTRAATG